MSRIVLFRLSMAKVLQVLACVLAMSSVACASNHEKKGGDAEAVDFTLSSELGIKSNQGVLRNPRILVVFEEKDLGGGNSILCPVGTQFVVGTQPLSTGVPTATVRRGNTALNVRWIAVNNTLDPLVGLTDFHYAAVFHPFRAQGNADFISMPHATSGGSGPTIQRIGPVALRFEETIPVGVDYKYTLVRVNNSGTDDNPNWEIIEDCDPLDPNIRVY